MGFEVFVQSWRSSGKAGGKQVGRCEVETRHAGNEGGLSMFRFCREQRKEFGCHEMQPWENNVVDVMLLPISSGKCRQISTETKRLEALWMRKGLRSHLPRFPQPAPHCWMVLTCDSREAKEILMWCIWTSMPATRIRTKLCLHDLHGQERKSLLLLWLFLLQSALTSSYTGLLMQRAVRQVLDYRVYALFFHPAGIQEPIPLNK